MNKRQFTTKLKDILEFNSTLRPNAYHKSGKVDQKRLGRFKTTERLFTKQAQLTDSNYHITLLLDASGSMNSSQRESVKKFAAILSKVFDEIKGITYDLVPFNTIDVIVDEVQMYDEIYHGRSYIYMNNDNLIMSPVSTTPKGYSFIAVTDSAACNIDAVHLFRAIERHSDKNHIMIVLSDGEPTDLYLAFSNIRSLNDSIQAGKIFNENQKGARKTLQKVVKIAKQRNIPLVSLGINTDYVRKYYPYWSKVTDEKEMFQAITHHLSRIIKKI